MKMEVKHLTSKVSGFAAGSLMPLFSLLHLLCSLYNHIAFAAHEANTNTTAIRAFPIFCSPQLLALSLNDFHDMPSYSQTLIFLINAMSSDFKLDAFMAHDYDGPLSISSSEEEKNWLNKAANTFHKQGIRLISSFTSNPERKNTNDRFSRLRHTINHIIHGPAKEEDRSRRLSGPLLSGAAYCISSCSMMLLNKVVLSSYNFNAGISLMFYQNLICTVVVLILGFTGAVSLERLNWKLIRIWVPVNLIFVGMLATGMFSLKYINIAMVTILKNMTNILTAIGEVYIFRRHQNHKVWSAMLLMIISALSGGITDLSFDAAGYAWQILNCVLTASYSEIMIVIVAIRNLSFLILQFMLNLSCLIAYPAAVMDKAKNFTSSGSLNEVSMVLLNNILSLPFAIILILLFHEWNYVINAEVIRLPMFWVVSTASGLLGIAISFTSMWFLHQTGPTTYSLVGSLNKIPISIAGIVLFKVPLSLPNFFSILFGLFAGVFFAWAKMS